MRLLFFLLSLLGSLCAAAQNFYLFIGTYTGTGSKGIYVYRFDAGTGKAQWICNTDSANNPSFLAMGRGDSVLYAVNEVASPTGGRLSAYHFNRRIGQLSLLNTQPTGGNHPCYVSVDGERNTVVAGNYSGGNLAVFATNSDGSLQPYRQLVQHSGSSVNLQRQTAPHVHATVFAPDGRYVFVPDLGIDKIMAYQYQKKNAQPLLPAVPPAVPATAGAGPRHLNFHPNGRWAYLMQELNGAVVAYAYQKGTLKKIQELPAHADTASGPFGSADIHVSPDGRFLYVSNRAAENNLAIFKVNQSNGQLTLVGFQSTLGLKPRNFSIDPTGRFLLVANQESDVIVVFKRNEETGLLTDTGERIEVKTPVCLVWGR
jgi:6-phosphogluconolactonase